MTGSSPRVLVIDDELPILRVLKSTLASSGFNVMTVPSGAAALQTVAQSVADVIVLDLGLPDMDGKEVIQALREWTKAPIVVLSARHDEEERIAALDLGADDYITKPFHMGELQARLRTALRHAQRQTRDASTYSGRGLEVDFDRRVVKVLKQEIDLTAKEYDLLTCLARHAGQVVTHKQLLAAGWGGTVTDTQFVRVYIGQIRQKLEADPSAPDLILTEPGIGYRLRTDEEQSL
ncbi:MAG: response regulator transcription factor [Bradyrhizobium sp.]|uniref:response regulator transcription factor n=1 Tax=Bradyrhizobium sp. TaxID=376 RepID=UPI00239CFCFC|nr:response regulator transcription factor [Bradyrhizobium sp.]MDE1934857.1 response regulator transcription factor [Bradyrhizobium sp.]MDE2061966.1 response regulator transcription factor [Bradyrhizobium sp.]